MSDRVRATQLRLPEDFIVRALRDFQSEFRGEYPMSVMMGAFDDAWPMESFLS